MAEVKLLKAGGGASDFAQIGATDTIPAANLPAASEISPAQITADQDNYNPTGWADADVVRLDFDTGGRGITGFTAWTNTRKKCIINTSANYGYIPCEHPDSTAANRVIGVCDHIIEPYGTLVIEYDGTSSRVRVLGNSFNPAFSAFSGKGGFFSVSPGATLGSDWGRVGFGISGGNNGTNTPTATLPGAWEVNTSTSATGAASLYFSKVVSQFHTALGHTIATCFMYIPTLSDGTETFTFSFGLAIYNSLVLDLANEITIRYSHALNSGKFQGVSRASSSQSSVDLGVTVAINTTYVLTVCIDDARSEARFYVNGAYSGRTTTNIPNTTLGIRSLIIKTAGTTQRNAYVANMTAVNVI